MQKQRVKGQMGRRFYQLRGPKTASGHFTDCFYFFFKKKMLQWVCHEFSSNYMHSTLNVISKFTIYIEHIEIPNQFSLSLEIYFTGGTSIVGVACWLWVLSKRACKQERCFEFMHCKDTHAHAIWKNVLLVCGDF